MQGFDTGEPVDYDCSPSGTSGAPTAPSSGRVGSLCRKLYRLFGSIITQLVADSSEIGFQCITV